MIRFLAVSLALGISISSADTKTEVIPDTGSADEIQFSDETIRAFRLESEADIIGWYDTDGTLTLENDRRKKDLNIPLPPRSSLEELKVFFDEQKLKSLIVVTIAKNTWTDKELSKQLTELRNYFIARGYKRIVIEQARASGIGIHLEYPEPEIPAESLILDLDASKGVVLEDGDRVASWKNQAPAHPEMVFVKRDEGRAEAGSGRPTLRKNATPDGKPSLVFLQQELVCMDEDAFDKLTTGKGHTWIAVIAVRDQRVGVKDVNSFFGNLRNGGKYEGVWGCLDDDNTLWWGARNGRSFGRFDENNPKVSGPMLERETFHVIAGRMDAGTGSVKLSLFANSAQPIATEDFPVDPAANPSRMAIGQERDAIEHPGKESFDGEISRLLIWEKPLTDAELAAAMKSLSLSPRIPAAPRESRQDR